jgi:prophage DNA circulation protein
MAVPNIFGTATAAIPLSNLDANFATPITLGNTAIQLGNTVTTLNNMTLANVTISSAGTAFPNNLLANSSVTLGNTVVALGNTATSLGNLTTANVTVTNYIETLQAVGTVGASSTLALTTGTVLTATLTASTPCTFTMPTAVAGKSFILILTQASSGMTTATFTSVKFPGGTAPTITATASAVDILSFVSNGTNWYGNYAQAFA